MQPPLIDLAISHGSNHGSHAEPTFSGVTSFMRRRYSKSLDGVDVAVIGVPFDLATTGRPGARLGPRAIREASAMLAWAPPYAWDFDPFERLNVIDYGDILIDQGRPERIPDHLAAAFSRIVGAGVTPLALGGDHFLSFPLLRALHAKHGPLALLHFDAHSDTWAEDEERIDHGTMFYHAARLGLVDPGASIQLGMRTHNADTHGFRVLDARWLHREGVTTALAQIRERIGERAVHVSFDIDFIDPAFAPGTGTPVVGGFDTHSSLELIRGLGGLNIVGMDVVEVAPAYDHADITALAGASIAHELLCAFASTER